MVTLELQLDSANALRANWPAILAAPGKLQELLDQEIVTVAAQAAINAEANWRLYTGRVDVRMYFRAFGEFIAEKTPYQTVLLDQQATQNIALFVLQQNPSVYMAFLAANDGQMLEILPPYEAPVVVVEPEIPPVDPEIPDGDGEPTGA